MSERSPRACPACEVEHTANTTLCVKCHNGVTCLDCGIAVLPTGERCQPCSRRRRGTDRTCRHCGEPMGKVKGRVCHPCRRVQRAGRCADCGDPIDPYSTRCKSCSKRGPLNNQWAGGRLPAKGGYWRVRVTERDPMWGMANNGYVLEHRLLMARYIGRPLAADEVVHHADRDPSNNDLSNLALLTNADHVRLHAGDRRVAP